MYLIRLADFYQVSLDYLTGRVDTIAIGTAIQAAPEESNTDARIAQLEKVVAQFTIEERKIMTAQVLRELRKGNKLSQKEAAAFLKIPATTYNTYESGRTEPPIEILVRLSHLYNTPVDLIVQRDRAYENSEEVNKQIAAYKAQLAELDQLMNANPGNKEFYMQLRDAMEKLADAIVASTENPVTKKALEEPFRK